MSVTALRSSWFVRAKPKTQNRRADRSRRKCPWADAYYHKKREEGQSHACALRCLGQRWLKILWKMWQTRERYDPELHQRNQLKHGSWVIGLMSAPNASLTTAGA